MRLESTRAHFSPRRTLACVFLSLDMSPVGRGLVCATVQLWRQPPEGFILVKDYLEALYGFWIIIRRRNIATKLASHGTVFVHYLISCVFGFEDRHSKFDWALTEQTWSHALVVSVSCELFEYMGRDWIRMFRDVTQSEEIRRWLDPAAVYIFEIDISELVCTKQSSILYRQCITITGSKRTCGFRFFFYCC